VKPSVERRAGAMRFVSLVIVLLAGLVGASPALAERVQGSGSTFAYPIISAWTKSFLEFRQGGSDFVTDELGVDYEPIGSLGGIMRLAQPEIDFAASDAPLSPEELAKRGLAQFPIVIGGLAAVVNLDGVQSGQLKLTGDVLAQIYLGKITKWNDPAVVGLNPGISLPDLAISVVHRSDGSGSTLTWTSYLSAANPDWKSGPGSDTLIEWPAGTSAEGTSGMLNAVAGSKGSIGYVEHGQAARLGLAVAQLSNGSGAFITPSPEIFAKTAAQADWDPARGFYLQLTDVQAADAYPLAAATFVLMHKSERSAARTRRALFFLSYALEQGGPDAARLGYVALPAVLVEKVKGYWHEVLPGAAGL
jgi:phosphate transport system substrate-binding protein